MSSSNSSNSHISLGQWHESNCFCGIGSPIRRASTKLNNERRFVGCARYPDRAACRYFVWLDPDELEVCHAHVGELEMELRTMSESKKKLEMELLQENEENRRLKSENGCLKKKLFVIVILLIIGLIVMIFASIDNDSRIDGRFGLP